MEVVGNDRKSCNLNKEGNVRKMEEKFVYYIILIIIFISEFLKSFGVPDELKLMDDSPPINIFHPLF